MNLRKKFCFCLFSLNTIKVLFPSFVLKYANSIFLSYQTRDKEARQCKACCCELSLKNIHGNHPENPRGKFREDPEKKSTLQQCCGIPWRRQMMERKFIDYY